MARLSFRCSDELVEMVDRARGRVPRERWLRDAVEDAARVEAGERRATEAIQAYSPPPAERALSEAQGPVATTQADPGPVPSPEGVRSAAPAEQLGAVEQASVQPPAPAPAEQPDMRAMDLLREDDPDPDFIARGRRLEFPPSMARVRSSAQARRDVKPFPKGKS